MFDDEVREKLDRIIQLLEGIAAKQPAMPIYRGIEVESRCACGGTTPCPTHGLARS